LHISTLLEVLISLFILALMLLGLDAMQLSSLRQAKTAYYFSVATQQLASMAEHVKAQSYPAFKVSPELPQGRAMLTGTYPNYTLSICWKGNPIGQSQCLRQTMALYS